MKKLILLVFCVYVGGVCASKLGQSCTTPGHKSGTGTLFKSCPELFYLERTDPKNVDLVKSSVMEKVSGKMIVCCPNPSDCRSARNNEPGWCIPIHNCEKLNALSEDIPLSPKTKTFLGKSQCGYNKGPLVCCAEQDMFIETATTTTTTTTTTESPPPPVDEKTALADRLKTSKLLPKAPKCGTELQKRIFGGTVATIYEFSWLVLLEYKKPNNKPNGFHCGGSLINDRYVLTAAHCLEKIDSEWELYSVRIGEHDLLEPKDCDPDDDTSCLPPVQNIQIAEKIVHPDYSRYNRDSLHDIALLRLKTKVKPNEFLKPICLPSAQYLWDKNYTGEKLKVAGWGKTEDQTKSTVKLYVELPFVDAERCEEIYQGGKNLIPEQMCAGGVSGKDSCGGDSGGPLMLKDLKNPFGSYYIAGVVSYGAGQCGTRGIPGVYTKVADYLEWIVDTIKP